MIDTVAVAWGLREAFINTNKTTPGGGWGETPWYDCKELWGYSSSNESAI